MALQWRRETCSRLAMPFIVSRIVDNGTVAVLLSSDMLKVCGSSSCTPAAPHPRMFACVLAGIYLYVIECILAGSFSLHTHA